MGELLSKFELLDADAKQQLLDYLDFLVSKKKKEKAKFDVKAYRENLLKVGVWSDEDIAPVEEARQLLNNWRIKEW
ncbi:MAG: hypothetical protein KF734_10900 [Saprospiraceae bacterium]|nr:hypothetical protein [Saprospiraceae bacterium]